MMIESKLEMPFKERITTWFYYNTETTPQDWSDYRQIFLNRATLAPTLVGAIAGSALLIASSIREGQQHLITHIVVGLVDQLKVVLDTS